MENAEWYLAPSYQDLETSGEIFEEDGKEYINVILKSGKVHAARVYRSPKRETANSNTTRHIIYSPYKELGFAPAHYITLVRCDDESALNGYCHFHPAFGAYLRGDESIDELPFHKGLHIKLQTLEWWEITDRLDHLLDTQKIKDIINRKEWN